MTAAMNGSINLSVADGWFPEFARHLENGFVIPVKETVDYFEAQDSIDHNNLYTILEREIISSYYQNQERWNQIVINSMDDVYPYFDSDRMVQEYFDKVYNF